MENVIFCGGYRRQAQGNALMEQVKQVSRKALNVVFPRNQPQVPVPSSDELFGMMAKIAVELDIDLRQFVHDGQWSKKHFFAELMSRLHTSTLLALCDSGLFSEMVERELAIRKGADR